MISFLRGKIINKRGDSIILDVRDIGYRVFVNETLRTELNVTEEVELYIYQHVREDILALYGFRQLDELELFELLLSISGIGPKSALSALGVASPDDIRASIAGGDSSLILKTPGIGKKTAERVVLELREKVGYIKTDKKTTSIQNNVSDEIDALITLGYSLQQAREALSKIDSSIKDSGERIRLALKSLGK